MTASRLRTSNWANAVATAVGIAVLIAGCAGAPAESKPEPIPDTTVARSAPAPSPSLSVNELMVNWVDNASHVLWDTEWPEGVPKNDADWTEIENHAMQLIAASTLLQLGGTGPKDAEWTSQDSWKAYANDMANAGRAGIGAARTKNMPALLAANTTLVRACTSCHMAFKPELPTEGKMHQNPHSASHRAP